MEVEIFVEDIIANDPRNPAYSSAIRNVEEEIRLSKDVGLTSNAETLENFIQTLDRIRFTHPLTNVEFELWKTYLPVHYRMHYKYANGDIVYDGCGLRQHAHDALYSLEEFDLDRVPRSVLELMRRATEEWQFDWLEIRTPVANIGPVLFGKKGNRNFLLARWAESRHLLLELDDLPHRVQRLDDLRKQRNTLMTGIMFISFFSIFGALLIAGATHNGWNGWLAFVLSIVVICFLGPQEKRLEQAVYDLYPGGRVEP